MPTVHKPDDLNLEYLHTLYSSKIFDDFIPKSMPSRQYEDIKLSTDLQTLKLVDKYQKDTIAIVHGTFVNYHNVDYFEVNYTRSIIKQRGYLTYLFEILINELNYKVLSDKSHTSPGSKEFWKSLIRKRKIKVYRINLESNYKRNAKKFDDEKIWGNKVSSNIVLNEWSKLEFIQNYNPQLLEQEYESELLSMFGNDLGDIDYLVNDIEESEIEKYEKQISMEKIRLIAQKK
ncbi:hypothetical protein [Aquimarina sediminis]|uniref:hypothetical protein n=1 Tax=Aquimarina sediminis TaxID=2070536 RepID=UPI000CA03080|nr:hypothetical protein [Aquimarina sediminis]